MKVTALVGSEMIRIDLESDVLDDVRATIQGRQYHLQLHEVEPGLFWFTREGKSVEVDVSVRDKGYEVRLKGCRLNVEILDGRALLDRRRSVGKSTHTEVRAPMPGRIVKILVEEGDSVDANQGLIVVEAMKMHNELCAPGSGKVERIAVAEGETIRTGDLLVVVD